MIVVALNSVAPSRTAAPDDQPDFYVGAAHLLHAALGDPLAQDIRTLANTNALIRAGLPATNGRPQRHGPAALGAQPGGLEEPLQTVPYIFIVPEDPSAITSSHNRHRTPARCRTLAAGDESSRPAAHNLETALVAEPNCTTPCHLLTFVVGHPEW